MRRFFFFIFFLFSCICASSEVVLAKTNNDTVFYRDYEHRDNIGIINKNQVVEIETSSIAHREDDNYWGFNLLLDEDNQLIRVKYKDSIGYANFADLESINSDCHRILSIFPVSA